MNLDLHFLKCCLCELLKAAAMAACIECSTNKNMEHAHKISSKLVSGCLFFGATKGKIETCDFDRHRICNDYMLHFGSCLLCAPFLLWLLLLLLQLQLYIYVYIFRSIWFDSKPCAFVYSVQCTDCTHRAGFEMSKFQYFIRCAVYAVSKAIYLSIPKHIHR